MWGVGCQVQSVECKVQSVEYVKSLEWSAECKVKSGVYNVKCGMGCVECKV